MNDISGTATTDAKTITVKYFAAVREALNQTHHTVITHATTLGQLRSELMTHSPQHAEALAPEKAVRMALNQDMTDESARLTPGCEVAFFPPVTGG